jgi:hypothetical protein
MRYRSCVVLAWAAVLLVAAIGVEILADDAANDVALPYVDLRTAEVRFDSDTWLLVFTITANAVLDQSYPVPSGRAIWFNIALDVDANPATGNPEHGIGMDYWAYVGMDGVENLWIAGLGKYTAGVWDTAYEALPAPIVSGSSITVYVPIWYMGQCATIDWYVNTFDNTTGVVVQDYFPDEGWLTLQIAQ